MVLHSNVQLESARIRESCTGTFATSTVTVRKARVQRSRNACHVHNFCSAHFCTLRRGS